MDELIRTDLFLDMLLLQERDRRIKYEASPREHEEVITDIMGTKYKVHMNGRKWDELNPCTVCDDLACLAQLNELSTGSAEVTVLCKNPGNMPVLRMLCQWRQHVKETYITEQEPGSDRWKKISICTSELTFLGRKTELGGIIGCISNTETLIHSIPSIASLRDVKGLSVGFIVLIAMIMDWDLYTEENCVIITRLLKKIRRGSVVGMDTYIGTPWYYMFKCILGRTRIPDKLRECILSRAHLP